MISDVILNILEKMLHRPIVHTTRDLLRGQEPHAAVLTCCDSRIRPSRIFHNLLGKPYQQQAAPLGGLFEKRTIGNIVPAYHSDQEACWDTAAFVAMACSFESTEAVAIIGHTQCTGIGVLMYPEDAPNALIKTWSMQQHALKQKILEKLLPTNLRKQLPLTQQEALCPNILHTLAPAMFPDKQTLIRRAIEQNIVLQIEHLQNYPAFTLPDRHKPVIGLLHVMEQDQILIYHPQQKIFKTIPKEKMDHLFHQKASLANIPTTSSLTPHAAAMQFSLTDQRND